MENHSSEVVPREFLCCRLCHEEYLEPVYLPCLHSFCRACIDDHIEATVIKEKKDTNFSKSVASETSAATKVLNIGEKTSLGDSKSNQGPIKQPTTFNCPVCGTPAEFSQEDYAISDRKPGVVHSPRVSLPDNLFARRLSCPSTVGAGISKRTQVVMGSGLGGMILGEEGEDQEVNKQTTTCAQCPQNTATPAEVQCLNCDEMFCSPCSLAHLAQAETASHCIQKLDIQRQSSLGGKSKSEWEDEEPGQPPPMSPALLRCCPFYDPLDIGAIFCVDCEMALCAECHGTQHAEHRCAELSAISQNFENKIKEPLDELRKDRTRLLKALSSLDAARKHSAQTQGGIKRLVRKRTKILCNLIQEYENVLVLELEKQHSHNIELISERENVIKKRIASTEAATDFTEKLLTFGSEEEKVSMRRKIGRRVRELCEEPLPSKRVHMTTSLLSEPKVMPETIWGMFGDLKVTEYSSNKKSTDFSTEQGKKHQIKQSQSIDMGMVSRTGTSNTRHSVSSMTDSVLEELADLEEDESTESGMNNEGEDPLSLSNTSDSLRPPSSMLSGSGNSSVDGFKLGNSFSSSYNSETLRKLPHKDAVTQNDSKNKKLIHHSGADSDITSHHQNLISNEEKLNNTKESNLLEVPELSQNDCSFHSNVSHDDVPCHNLEIPRREVTLPETVSRDPIKGVGVNPQGDIVIGTVSLGGSSNIFLLEKHGIVRGQIPVERGWTLYSVAADGKVSLVVTRGENRYKVKVFSGENSVDVLVDVHIESFGLSSVTATKNGHLLVAATRYATPSTVLGKAGAKPGGNITIYDKSGTVQHVITNETYPELGIYLFDRPHQLSVDTSGNFFVADPGRHSVIGLTVNGEFMFEHGNSDAEEELYQGPDVVTPDRHGNLVVFDKKDGRIDILNYEGVLQRCYFPSQHIRFVCPTPDKMLLLVNSEGEIKLYDYT